MKKLIALLAAILAAAEVVAQVPSKSVAANPNTGALIWPLAASFATANDLARASLTPTITQLNGYFADPSSNGSFSASAWKADLAIAQADVAGLTTVSSPTFAGLTLSGPGIMSIGSTADLLAASTAYQQIIGKSGAGANLALVSYTASPSYRGFGVQGTPGSVAATTSGQTILTLMGGGYDGTSWVTGAGYIQISTTQNWTSSAHGIRFDFLTTENGSTSAVSKLAIFDWGGWSMGRAGGSTTAWGTDGVVSRTSTSKTWIDTTPGDTSATTVFSSFAIPVLNSSSAKIYSGILANVYIAGDPTVTGNATLTGTSYGLDNEGKTRLAGALQFPSTNTVGAQWWNTADMTSTTTYERLEILWSGNTGVVRVAGGSASNSRNLNLAATSAATGTSSLTIRPATNALGAFQFIATTSGTAATGIVGYVFSGFTSSASSGTAIGFSQDYTFTSQSSTAGWTAEKINATSGGGSGTKLLADWQVGSVTQFSVSSVGNQTLTGSITTGAPSGGTAAAWKFGTVSVTSPTSPNRTIQLDVGGTIYYLAAKTTNN